jgi:hypothetical protein
LTANTNDIINQNQSKRPRDHWQDEKDRLIAKLERKILGRREQITVQEISAVPMPELLLAAFRNHAHGIVRREKPLVLQSSHRFVLEDDDVKAHLRRLRELLIDRLVMPRDEVIEVIVFAVRLQFDVITKPRAALVDLLYERALERDRDDIRTIVAGLGEQRPMISALLDLIGGYPAGPVNREAFVALCRRAERIVYSDKPVTALMADLNDVANFCSAIDGKPVTEVDNQTVLGILFERNLKELAEGLLPTLTQKDKWTLLEIEKILEHQIVSSGLALGAESPGQVFLPPEIDLSAFLDEAPDEIRPDLDKNGPGGNTESAVYATTGDDHADLKDAGAFERVYDLFTDSPESDTSPDPQAAAQNHPAAGRPAAREFQVPISYQPLHRLIDGKSQALFVKKIFRKDAEAYGRFIDSLELAENWKAAKEILDEELSMRKINPYSKEAVRLSDVVFSRYFPRR